MTPTEALLRRALRAALECQGLAEAAKVALSRIDNADGLDFGYAQDAGQQAAWVSALYERRRDTMLASGFLGVDASLARLRATAGEFVRLAHVDTSIIMWMRDGDDCPVALFAQES